jgi:hypothetical protein
MKGCSTLREDGAMPGREGSSHGPTNTPVAATPDPSFGPACGHEVSLTGSLEQRDWA